MRHQDIKVGDSLKLKRDNNYGFGAITVEVSHLIENKGYKVPFVYGAYWQGERLEFGYFKPSDFSGAS